MAANCQARDIRVLIGDDAQDWSEAVGDFAPGHESIAEDGLILTTATLEIFDIGPESIDPRANPTRWREGQLVQIANRNDADTGWVVWGNLRIMLIPNGPEDGVLEVELGCWLAWAGKLELEADESGITLGTAENSAAVATRLLEAAGIPSGAISLSGWDYTIDYPLPKEGNGSFVSQAAKLAFANNHRHLVQYPDGIIRAVQWSTTPGTPIAAITVGVGERQFTAQPDPVQPVEQVVVSGQGFPTTLIPNRYSSSSFTTEPASNFSDTAIGTVVITTTVVGSWGEPDEDHDYYWNREEVRIRGPRATVWIGSDSLQPTTVTTYKEKRYDPDTKILYREEDGEICHVRAFVPAGDGGFGTTFKRRNIKQLTYNDAEVLVAIDEEETVPRIALEGINEGANRFVQETSKDVQTTWTEERPDFWVKITKARQAAGQSANNRAEDIKPTALVSEPAQVERDSRPAATERWEDPNASKEEHYTATATWTHPGGATGLTRTLDIVVEPGFSNAQCFDIATREVQLLEGRRLAYIIQLPITDALLWVAPLSTLTVDDGDNLWTFKIDAAQWLYGVEESSLSVAGICVARVPAEEPVGVPLPEFESGLDPGQEAPEEPPAFVPPTDDVVDVEVALSAAPATISATTEAAPVVDSVVVALSAAPAQIAATTESTPAVAVALSAAPAAIAATVQSPVSVSAALSAAPASIAAEVELTTVVAAALSAAPAQIAAAAIVATNFEPETDTLLAALTGTYDSTRQEAIDALIVALKAAGVWSTRDVLCIAGLNSADSLINWIDPGTFDSSLVNTPSFTADRGFTGNGTSSYINTNFNPSTAGGNFSLNSAHLGLYCRTDSNPSLARDMGARTAFNDDESVLILRETGNAFCGLNSNGVTTATTSGNSTGYWSSSRTASNALALRRNGSSFTSSTLASAAMPNLSMYVGAVNSGGSPVGYTTRQYAAWSIGGGLTGTQLADEYTAIQAYMTAIGANV